MAAKPRIKTAAAVYTAQSRDDVAADIKVIGDIQRDLARMSADMNDAIGEITARHQPAIDAAKARIDVLQQGIQGWCEAHRDDLTQGGKVKSAQFVTGEVAWRARPPSVGIRGVDTVIDTLKRLGFGRFVRVKEEINKEAILNEPDEVRGVAGITLNTGVEDFLITPFEADS